MTSGSVSWLRRVLRWTLAIVLLPVCGGLSWAVFDLVAATGIRVQFWVPFFTGGLCWLILFLSLPKPMWIYVVGHELTHALWALLFGGRIKRFKATSRGGHVVVTKSNSLIVLAPYFFPLYAVLWVLLFLFLGLWLDTRPLRLPFYFGLGFAYLFHVTLTGHVLRVGQSDLRSEGWVFSVMLIWLAHGLLLLLALPLLTQQIGLLTAASWWLDRTSRLIAAVARLG